MKKLRTQRANSLSLEDSNSEKMTIQGRFIVLYAVNMILQADYEYVLRICSTNFSYIANTSLFEGNILRLKSIACEQIFKIKDETSNKEEEDSENQKQIISMLFMAIDSARNGLSIYQSDNHTKKVENIYGIALQNFQIGYLLKTYASKLCT